MLKSLQRGKEWENKRDPITCNFAFSFPKSASAVPNCETPTELVERKYEKRSWKGREWVN